MNPGLARPEGGGSLRRDRLGWAHLYFVCEARPRDDDPERMLRAALSGGVQIVQLRDKDADRDVLYRSGQTFRRLADDYSAVFILNDDPHLARELRADGVHLGQDDMPVAEARELLGLDVLIGLSTHSEEQIAAGAQSGADYLSVGPVWETPTKPGRPAVGLELVRGAASSLQLPFFAIGGIDTGNIGEVVEAGASRACVVRAIRDAEDPNAVASALSQALDPKEMV